MLQKLTDLLHVGNVGAFTLWKIEKYQHMKGKCGLEHMNILGNSSQIEKKGTFQNKRNNLSSFIKNHHFQR